MNAHAFLGYIDYRLGRYDEAALVIKKAIELADKQEDKQLEGLMNVLYRIYRDNSELDKAILVLEQLIQLYPKDTYRLKLNELKDEIVLD